MSTRQSTITLLTALLLAPLAALHAASVEMLPMSEPDEAVPLPELSFYVKRETLPRTLVATRLALRQWQEEQARTRPATSPGRHCAVGKCPGRRN